MGNGKSFINFELKQLTMQRNKWREGFCLGLLLIGAVAAVKYMPTDTSVEKPVASSVPAKMAATQELSADAETKKIQRAQSSAVAPHSPPAPQELSTARLLNAFNNLHSGRAFVFDAWQRPQEGGQFYASRVVDFCAGIWRFTDIMSQANVTFDIDMSAVDQERKTKAFDSIKARCADFVNEDFNAMGTTALLESRKSSGDPLFLAVTGVSDRLEKRQAIRNLIEVGDPVALDAVGSRLVIYSNPTQGHSMWFQGVSYPVSRTPELMAAFYLLPCSLGLRCDASDPRLQRQCAVGGQCYADRNERALRELANSDPAVFAEIVRWQNVLADTVRKKDYAAFLAPS